MDSVTFSYGEITAILGRAISKPDLKYSKITDEQFRGALMRMVSESAATLMVEMATSMDSGYIKPLEPRSPRNTTSASYEAFVAENFVPLYQAKRPAA